MWIVSKCRKNISVTCYIALAFQYCIVHATRNTNANLFLRGTLEDEKFREILEEQDSVVFRPGALFRNDEEVPDISEMDAEEALALARQRAKKPAARPTSRSVIEIGLEEGRCTREVELYGGQVYIRIRGTAN